ncbi:MAG: rhamnulokinase [Phycisphaerales bacterium]|nr:MAG: rhamnulokinase [Phycisphaerales bacterium]
MAATSNYLAFDLGASSGRAVLGMFDGDRLTLEEIHRFANGPVTIRDHLHWDAPRLFAEIKSALAKCARRRRALDGIGIDTWGVDYALLSPAGQMLDLPFHYRDSRTRGMMAEAFHLVPREEIYERTGIQFMEFNTLYQLLSVATTDRATLDAAGTLLFMPDLFNYWLTGVKQSEYSIATTSQLYDALRGGWATHLMAKLNLPAEIMPHVVPPASPVGDLLPEIADGAGLAPAPVVAPACHDTGSAVAAVPAHGQGWAYISSGTWSLVGVEVPEPICDTEALTGNFTNEGGVAGTVRFLKNVAGLWLVQECKRTWEARGESVSYEKLTEMADAAPSRVSFVDPDDPRFAEPGDMPRRIRDCCAAGGQPVPESTGQIVRCALESLALKYRTTLHSLERITGWPVEVVHVVGGGANNRLLCRLTADITGKPVVAGPAEATAAGNVMVQALARGRVSSLDQVRRVIAASTPLQQYDPDPAAGWDDAIGRFEALLADDTVA